MFHRKCVCFCAEALLEDWCRTRTDILESLQALCSDSARQNSEYSDYEDGVGNY